MLEFIRKLFAAAPGPIVQAVVVPSGPLLIDVQYGGLSTQNGVRAKIVREGDSGDVVRGSSNATAHGRGSSANAGIKRGPADPVVPSSGPAILRVEARATVQVEGATSVSLTPAAKAAGISWVDAD
jgi:hypothetical protein